MSLPSLPQDKANHVLYGALIFLVAYALLLLFGVPHSAYAALAVSVGFGLGKEGVDAWENHKATGDWRTGPHGVEGLDAAATAAGGLVTFLSAGLAGGVASLPKSLTT